MKTTLISAQVLDQARLFFEDRGAYGHEATALIARRGGGVADRLAIPTQHAVREGVPLALPVAVAYPGALGAALVALGAQRVHRSSHPER